MVPSFVFMVQWCEGNRSERFQPLDDPVGKYTARWVAVEASVAEIALRDAGWKNYRREIRRWKAEGYLSTDGPRACKGRASVGSHLESWCYRLKRGAFEEASSLPRVEGPRMTPHQARMRAIVGEMKALVDEAKELLAETDVPVGG